MELEAGAVDGAVALASKALALLGEDADSRNLACLRSQLGIMQMQMDPPELEDAIANLTAAGAQMSFSGASRIDRLRNDAALARAALMGGDHARATQLADEVYASASAEAPLLAADVRALQGQAAIAIGDNTAAASLFKHAVLILTGIGADREAGQLWLELATLLESVGEEAAARQAYRSAAAAAGLRARPRAVLPSDAAR